MAYVYALVDPRDDSWFYVGKGTGRRMRKHFSPSLLKKETHKARKIRKLQRDGHEPYGEKLVNGIDEELACFIEGELIDKHYDDLTNYCRAGEPRWSDGMPEEIRQKIKERTPSPKGRTMSEETRERMQMVQRGTNAGSSKLTGQEAAEVKWYLECAEFRFKKAAVAEEYGISPATVANIQNGHAWEYLAPKEPDETPEAIRESNGRLRKEDAAEIKWLAQKAYNQRQIAHEYGIGIGGVSDIKNELNWTHVEAKKPEAIPNHFEKTYTQLSEQEAAEAKWLLENGYSRKGIGEFYGVAPEHVYKIRIGKCRPELESQKPSPIPEPIEKTRLTEQEAGEIKYLARDGELSQSEIAEMYDVAQSQVSRIKRRKRWPNVTANNPA